jgi:HEAT repeat protein
VPFAGRQIRVLGPDELVLFKALFDRPKDWVDIEAVVQAGAADLSTVRRGLVELLGDDDPRLGRWDTLTR